MEMQVFLIILFIIVLFMDMNIFPEWLQVHSIHAVPTEARKMLWIP